MNVEGVNEIIDEMYESNEMMCGIDEIVRMVCGKGYYGNWGKEELDYVEEVMEEFGRIYVSFDLENEVMNIEGEVDS